MDLRTGAAGTQRALGVGFARGDRIELESPHPTRRSRKPDHEGRITALRSPLTPSTDTSPLGFEIDLEPEPEPPAGIAWGGVIPSVVTGAVAALLFSPLFALLAGGSVLVLIGRWVAGRLSYRRARRRRSEAIASARRNFHVAAARWLDVEVDRRRAAVLSPAGLARQVSEQRTPWLERFQPDAGLDVVAGFGSGRVPFPPAVDQEGLRSLGLADDLPAAEIPFSVRLAEGRGLAVTGDRADAMASGRWIVGSVASRIGPADLRIVLITSADRLVDWEWTKWIPSLEVVAVGPDEIDAVLGPLAAEGAPGTQLRPSLTVIDGPEPTGPGPLALLVGGRVDRARFLWIGDVDEVPAGCSHRLHRTADGRAELSDLCLPEPSIRLGQAWTLSNDDAEAAARWLAPFTDPEREEAGSGLPVAVSLEAAAGIAGDLEIAIRSAWDEADPTRLMVPLGGDRNGPVELDLVAAGPHGLVAGTTGSGKSELLRSLVAGAAMRQPPDLLEFVLFDFKGGGAFDLVAGLPHVAAVVTDLDPDEARRAIQGLRAEVLEREERLRAMGISDIGAAPRRCEGSFPRLVVIVDEFAALADELPDVLDGLVDIARRGRSLGVHLILATQRPAGIVTGQIRANTNLRLCLRVQDRADSFDVIDCADAADLPSIPGRVVARLDAGPVHHFQVAPVVGRPVGALIEPFVLHDSQLQSRLETDRTRSVVDAIGSLIEAATATEEGVTPRSADTITAIIAATNKIAAAAGRLRPSAPWLEPIDSVGWSDLRPLLEAAPLALGTIPLGLLDDPIRRRRVVAPWNPGSDGLLVLGADRCELEATVSAAVASMVATALADDEPMPWIYVLDGGSDDLATTLSRFPNVVDVIGAGEPDRILKAVEMLTGGAAQTLAGDVLLIVNGWAEISEVLDDVGGPDAVGALGRLVRRSGSNPVRAIVTAASDRDVPSRITSHLAVRVLHRQSDSASLLTFGLRPKDVPSLTGARFVDPTSGLDGRIVRFGRSEIVELAERARSARVGLVRPPSVRVLGSSVDRTDLPVARADEHGWIVPVGLDTDLAPQGVHLGPRRPLIVLGQPGTGRSTALRTIRASLPDSAEVVVLDDAETLTPEEAARQLERAASSDAAIVIACTPFAARSFGGWIAPLLPNAAVVLLNPTRADGEMLRVVVPDLSREPVGRAALVERGRVSVFQVAA